MSARCNSRAFGALRDQNQSRQNIVTLTLTLNNESVLWHLSRSSGLGLVGGFPNVTPGGMPVNGLYDKSKTDGHDGHHNHAISMNILNLKGERHKTERKRHI